MKRILVEASFLSFFFVGAYGTSAEMSIGSKKFTESVLLGEVTRLVLEGYGVASKHRRELGGTRVLWNALNSGDLTVYPEYTGTLAQELLPGVAGLDVELHRRGLVRTKSLGFNDTYAIGIPRKLAEAKKIRTLSDLAAHPELRWALSSEFKGRADGWGRLQAVYRLQPKSLQTMDHEVAYRAIGSGDVDVVDLYSTDAEILYYDLIALTDDKKVFPPYEAILIYRLEALDSFPKIHAAFAKLEGSISEKEMIAMNARVKLDRVSESEVAREFVEKKFHLQPSVSSDVDARTWRGVLARVGQRFLEHFRLVAESMLLAVLVGIPLGILAAKLVRVGAFVLAVVGWIQTIPALALLVLMMVPLKALGLSVIGDTPAVIALFLYSLLPIVRNTYAGIQGIAPSLRESAKAVGLPPGAILTRIELPLASPVIFAGVATAIVINIGFATLGALVGAGGFGQPILAGIRLDDYGILLEGAIPAALFAILAQAVLARLGRRCIPRGLRL